MQAQTNENDYKSQKRQLLKRISTAHSNPKLDNTLDYIQTLTMIFTFTVFSLWLLGRNLICKCGEFKFWHGITKSSENSQHLFDPYTFTHIVHGILFYLLLTYFGRNLSNKTKFLWAFFIECLWEVVENTSFVIEKYRTATVALDYYGDSIVNSIGDIIAMALGFFIGMNLSLALSIVLILIIELILSLTIKDNLANNIFILLRPSTHIENLKK